MEQLNLPEDTSAEIKTFMLTVARDQYMSGNKSGIRWARLDNEEEAKNKMSMAEVIVELGTIANGLKFLETSADSEDCEHPSY